MNLTPLGRVVRRFWLLYLLNLSFSHPQSGITLALPPSREACRDPGGNGCALKSRKGVASADAIRLVRTFSAA